MIAGNRERPRGFFGPQDLMIWAGNSMGGMTGVSWKSSCRPSDVTCGSRDQIDGLQTWFSHV